MAWQWPRRRQLRHEAPPAPEAPAPRDWTEILDTKFQLILDAQEDLALLLQQLNVHVSVAHDGRVSECDVWCWPRTVRRTLAALTDQERWVFQLVLLKDWFWSQLPMEPWLLDASSGPDDSPSPEGNLA